uniref:Uncharacterized protein n=1 Tax=Glossina austeni TaxID=7395 RepID=A0A1A9UY64_GLOAU
MNEAMIIKCLHFLIILHFKMASYEFKQFNKHGSSRIFQLTTFRHCVYQQRQRGNAITIFSIPIAAMTGVAHQLPLNELGIDFNGSETKFRFGAQSRGFHTISRNATKSCPH